MARLVDAEEFEAYCIERDPKYSEAEWQAYLDGVQRVLEAIDAAPTMTKYVRCEDCDEVVNSIIRPDLYYCMLHDCPTTKEGFCNEGHINKRYRDLMEISNLYLRGEKTLDEVVDAIRLMLAYDMWTKMFEEADVKVNAIGGHGPASPYDQPLMAETNYSAQLRYELETPVRRAKEVDKAYDKT